MNFFVHMSKDFFITLIVTFLNIQCIGSIMNHNNDILIKLHHPIAVQYNLTA